jgi:hypothetical protein
MPIRYFLIFFTFCLFLASPLHAALAAPVSVAQTALSPGADLSREAVEAKLGRKLKFTERIGLSMVRKKARKATRKQLKSSPDGRIVDGLSLTSMILGILAFLGVITGLSWFSLVFAVGALVLGIIGLGRVNRDPGYLKGKGFAIAGIALGGSWFFLGLLAVAIIILAFNGL